MRMSSEILGKAPPPPPPVLCWTGFIVHATAGAGRSKANASLLRVETPPRAQILWTNKMSKTLLSVRFVVVALPEAEPGGSARARAPALRIGLRFVVIALPGAEPGGSARARVPALRIGLRFVVIALPGAEPGGSARA